MIVEYVEKVLENKIANIIVGIISLIAPLYFLSTLYEVWFGSHEVFRGFYIERWTWLVLSIVDGVGFLTTLPAREKGRIIQVVMAMWTIEMFLVYMATLVRVS